MLKSFITVFVLILTISCNAFAQQASFYDIDHYYKSLIWNNLGFKSFSHIESKNYLATDFFQAEKETQSFIQLDYHFLLDTLSQDVYVDKFIRNWPEGDYAVITKMQLAHKAYQQGNYAKAIEDYEQVLEIDQEKYYSDKVLFWMAEVALTAKNSTQARVIYLRLADTFPKSKLAPPSLYARGATLLMEEQFNAASEAFELLKNRYPNDPITRKIGTALGEAYYQQRKFEECIKALNNELPLLEGEEQSKAVFLIAESYNYLQQFDNASSFYLRYINLNKGQEEEKYAQYGLGWVYHKQGIYHWAAESFEKAVGEDDQLSRKALYYKAVNQKLAGLFPKSMQTFEEFGATYTEGFWIEEAYYEWAISTFEFSDYTKTIEILLSIIRSDTELKQKGKLFSLLGEAYFANKEYTRAIQAFDEAAEATDIDPQIKIQARFQKAWLLYRNQAYEQAQPQFYRLFQDFPDAKIASEALFWSADSYYSLEDYGPAGAQFEKFVNLYPNHKLIGAARYSLGWSHFKMAEYARAIEPFETFLANYQPPPVALFPYDIDSHLRLGDSHYALREYDVAISHYEEAIGADPGGDYALFQIGNAYYRSDRTYEAVVNFRKMLRIYPYSTLREQAQYNIGYIYFLMGNYDQAIVEFNTLIKKYKRTNWAARAQYNIGDAYYNAGQYQNSITAYQKVLDEFPKSNYILEAVNGIQYAQLANGQEDSSDVIFEQFILQNPSTRTADRLRFRQAENLLQQGDYPGAIESFEEYIRISTNKRLIPDASFRISEALELQGKNEESILHLKDFISTYPNAEKVPQAMSQLGRYYLNQAKYDSALTYFDVLNSKYSDYKAEGLIGLGNVWIGKRDYQKARTYFEQGSTMFPNNDAIKIGIAKVNFEEMKDDVALPQLQAIANKNTGVEGAEAQYLVGRILQDQKKFEKAIEAYAKVKILYEAYEEWVSLALLESSLCYKSINNPIESKKTLELILDSYPQTDAAQRAQEMLDEFLNK